MSLHGHKFFYKYNIMFRFDLFNSWIESKPGLDIELSARQTNINKFYLNLSRVILKQLSTLKDPSIKHAYLRKLWFPVSFGPKD